MTHASRAECDAALPHILAAPKGRAPIESLCFRPDYGARAFPEALRLSVAGGIEGERWLKAPWIRLPDGRPDPRIQVSILSRRVLDLVWRDKERAPHPGDTMIVDMDLSEAALPVGARLRAGTALLEVTDLFNTGCRKWHERYGAPSLAWINAPENRPHRLRGVLCRIVGDGEVRHDDWLEAV